MFDFGVDAGLGLCADWAACEGRGGEDFVVEFFGGFGVTGGPCEVSEAEEGDGGVDGAGGGDGFEFFFSAGLVGGLEEVVADAEGG